MSSTPGRVETLHINIRTRQPMRRLEAARAVAGAGLEGCRHSKPGNDRAVLLVEGETLDELRLEAGEIKENITTRGIELRSLPPGSRLQIGEEVIVEITGPCAPCRRMDEIRPGLKAELAGRRGLNSRVLVGGTIKTADAIVLVKPGRTLP
jgi:MOSC domain-containing protein YiiM